VDLVTIIQYYKRMQKLLSSNVLFLAGLSRLASARVRLGRSRPL
jgi:hypothetical protein